MIQYIKTKVIYIYYASGLRTHSILSIIIIYIIIGLYNNTIACEGFSFISPYEPPFESQQDSAVKHPVPRWVEEPKRVHSIQPSNNTVKTPNIIVSSVVPQRIPTPPSTVLPSNSVKVSLPITVVEPLPVIAEVTSRKYHVIPLDVIVDINLKKYPEKVQEIITSLNNEVKNLQTKKIPLFTTTGSLTADFRIVLVNLLPSIEPSDNFKPYTDGVTKTKPDTIFFDCFSQIRKLAIETQNPLLKHLYAQYIANGVHYTANKHPTAFAHLDTFEVSHQAYIKALQNFK